MTDPAYYRTRYSDSPKSLQIPEARCPERHEDAVKASSSRGTLSGTKLPAFALHAAIIASSKNIFVGRCSEQEDDIPFDGGSSDVYPARNEMRP
jgi:hypothetical protein